MSRQSRGSATLPVATKRILSVIDAPSATPHSFRHTTMRGASGHDDAMVSLRCRRVRFAVGAFATKTPPEATGGQRALQGRLGCPYPISPDRRALSSCHEAGPIRWPPVRLPGSET